MKRILIAGAKSYVGMGVEQCLHRFNGNLGREEYRIDTISLREESWRLYDFSPYDALLHVAGIAHADVEKVTEEEKEQYYRINCDLAEEVAQKAKEQGIPQFIYMSSMIVYGEGGTAARGRIITEDTPPAPANFYGDSKLKAENKLRELASADFKVAILRPPMIYGMEKENEEGTGGRGNYALLCRLAEKVTVFPKIKNERSMLYMGNLGEFIRLLIESGEGGIFYPQNGEYVSTSLMVQTIGKSKGRKIHLLRILNPFVYLGGKLPGKIGRMVNKAFGSMVYGMDMSREKVDGYQIYTLEESLK